MVGFLPCVRGKWSGAGGGLISVCLAGWSGNFFNRSPITLKFGAEKLERESVKKERARARARERERARSKASGLFLVVGCYYIYIFCKLVFYSCNLSNFTCKL